MEPDPTWMAIAGMAVGAAVATVTVLALMRWQVLRRLRWQCQGCAHPYTLHLTPDGHETPCMQGLDGLAGVLSGGCGCQVYLGKRPRPGLLRALHAPDDPPVDCTCVAPVNAEAQP